VGDTSDTVCPISQRRDDACWADQSTCVSASCSICNVFEENLEHGSACGLHYASNVSITGLLKLVTIFPRYHCGYGGDSDDDDDTRCPCFHHAYAIHIRLILVVGYLYLTLDYVILVFFFHLDHHRSSSSLHQPITFNPQSH
jgi:hypothetical protein